MKPLEVILLSGGVESSTLLHLDHDEYCVKPLFVDYGQRAAEREYEAAQQQCGIFGLSLLRLDMSPVGRAFRAQQHHALHVPIPHRNLVILSVGLSYASQHGAERLCLALNAEDTHTYASAAAPFVDRFQSLAQTLEPIAISTPLIDKTKADIVRMGQAIGMEYADTYSCLLGYERHCGLCPQCKNRKAAFVMAGVGEPKDFYTH